MTKLCLGLLVPMLLISPAYTCTILVLGNDLSTNYISLLHKDFIPQLQNKLHELHYNGIEIVNSNVDDNTTTKAKQQLLWNIKDKPNGMVIALGKNDKSHSISPVETKANLAYIIETLQEYNIKVLLTGMSSPANANFDYTIQFNDIFPYLAHKYKTLHFPSYLTNNSTHPNEKKSEVIAANIIPYIVDLIEKSCTNYTFPITHY